MPSTEYIHMVDPNMQLSDYITLHKNLNNHSDPLDKKVSVNLYYIRSDTELDKIKNTHNSAWILTQSDLPYLFILLWQYL